MWRLLCGVVVIFMAGCADPKIHMTNKLVSSKAYELSMRTTDSGALVRYPHEDLKEVDSWGTPLKVFYRVSRTSERVIVTSAGRDGVFFTRDDIVAWVRNRNYKGATAAVGEAAKNITKGALQGIKEGMQK